MENQGEIGLSGDQRESIVRAIRRTQDAVLDVQWEIKSEEQRLEALLGAEPVDSDAALAHITQMLELEQRVKVAHMRLLIDIKNALTTEQRRRLGALRGR